MFQNFILHYISFANYSPQPGLQSSQLFVSCFFMLPQYQKMVGKRDLSQQESPLGGDFLAFYVLEFR